MNELPPSDAQRRAAFLLRLWRDDGQPGWRALLRPVPDGPPVVFASLEALNRHLQEMVCGSGHSQASDPQETNS